jgi:adenylate cyclase
MDGIMGEVSTSDEIWRSLLTDVNSPLRRAHRIMKFLPASERCKVCNVPFTGPSAPLLRLGGLGRARMNPRFCCKCENMANKHPGGAEIDLTMMFADVRGSTALAESLGTAEFTRLIARFYDTVTHILIDSDAFIDRLIGDEVIALFLPLTCGPDNAARAVDAARRILLGTGHADPEGPWVPVGVGIHTGQAFVGAVGTSGVRDFTALGDDVNATARLASSAGPGEILVSTAAAAAARLETSQMESRQLTLKGRQQPMDVYVTRLEAAAAAS